MSSQNLERVLVVGSLNMDLVARVPRLPAPGETLASQDFATVAGGKGANQAVAAARLGARTAMVGCVGDDTHGRRLQQALRDEGIDTQAVRTHATAPTGMALVTVDEASRNHIVLVPGANALLDAQDLAAVDALLRGSAVVVCQLEVPLPVVRQVLQRARAAGCTTLLNPAPAAVLDAALLEQVDWLIPNEVEAALLSGVAVTDMASARQAADLLRAAGSPRVLVTLGAQGALLADAAGMRHFAAPAVVAVDTTAAGDTFIGGLAAQLAAGVADDDAIRFAQAAAALSVMRHGAQPSIPQRHEVLAALQAG